MWRLLWVSFAAVLDYDAGHPDRGVLGQDAGVAPRSPVKEWSPR